MQEANFVAGNTALQCSDRGKQLAAMSYKVDTDVPEDLGGKLRQYSGVDLVIAKGLFVLLQPKAVEPRCDVHARLPDAVTAARLIVPRIVGAGEYSARLVAAHGEAAHHAAIAKVIGPSGGRVLRQAATLTRLAYRRLWVISGCAGPSAARQVNLKKRTPRLDRADLKLRNLLAG
jgi:hypothetical protein